MTEVTYHCINFNNRVTNVPNTSTIGSEKFQIFFWNFSDSIVEVNAVLRHFVIRGSLYEKFGNKCVKILKFWRTELSYAQNKNKGRKMRFLGMS